VAVLPFWVRRKVRCFVSDFGKIKDKYKKDLIDNIEWEEEGHTEDLILKL
jgi:hypothetical protein